MKLGHFLSIFMILVDFWIHPEVNNWTNRVFIPEDYQWNYVTFLDEKSTFYFKTEDTAKKKIVFSYASFKDADDFLAYPEVDFKKKICTS